MTAAARVRWSSGSLLTAGDLHAWSDAERHLGRAHVRGVHDTWGIALGFEIWRSGRGEEVLVGPGLAYDCHGREILSDSAVVLAPPRETTKGRAVVVDLLVSHRDSDTWEVACDDDGEQERPRWRWSLAGRFGPRRPPLAPDVRRGEEIPLARFRLAGRMLGPPDLSVRPSAATLVNPVLRTGRVAAPVVSGSIAHWSFAVSTAGAGLTRRPTYFAWLEGDLLEGVAGRKAVLGPLLSIRDATQSGFTLEARCASAAGLPAALRAQATFALPVAISWLAVAVAERCPPPLDLRRLRRASGAPYAGQGFTYLEDMPTEGEVVLG